MEFLLGALTLFIGVFLGAIISSPKTKEQKSELTFDQNTLNKVYSALSEHSISKIEAMDIVNQLHNNGVLFRERAPS